MGPAQLDIDGVVAAMSASGAVAHEPQQPLNPSPNPTRAVNAFCHALSPGSCSSMQEPESSPAASVLTPEEASMQEAKRLLANMLTPKESRKRQSRGRSYGQRRRTAS